MSAYNECYRHETMYDTDSSCPGCDQENEDRIRQDERERVITFLEGIGVDGIRETIEQEFTSR